MDALLKYCEYDEVRAVLGISDDEVEDATLGLPKYYKHLILDLDALSENITTQYDTLKAIAPGSRTKVQTRFLNTVDLYAQYNVAMQLLRGGEALIPKTIEDGKAKIERVGDIFKSLRLEIAGGFRDMETRLIAAAQAVGITISTAAIAEEFIVASAVSTSPDPVTNV